MKPFDNYFFFFLDLESVIYQQMIFVYRVKV